MIDRVRVLVFSKSGSVNSYTKIVELLMEYGYIVSKTEMEEIYKKSIGLEPRRFDVAVVIQRDGKFKSIRVPNSIETLYCRNQSRDLHLLKLRLAEIQKS
jgi:hypothetical protein